MDKVMEDLLAMQEARRIAGQNKMKQKLQASSLSGSAVGQGVTTFTSDDPERAKRIERANAVAGVGKIPENVVIGHRPRGPKEESDDAKRDF